MKTIVDNLIEYPFLRLDNFLKNKPAKKEKNIIDLSMGEPQHSLPNILYESLEKNQHLWNKYPPVNGTSEYRAAVFEWLKNRYKLKNDFLDPDLNVLPVSGTREGLYSLTQFLTSTTEKKKKCVGMSNPFYQTYYAAAIMSNSKPILFTALPENNFLPSLSDIFTNVYEKLSLFFICSPTNPHGTFASHDYIKMVIKLAQEYNFIAVFDECYSEIYLADPPVGALEVCSKENISLKNVIIFNSLSKRSSAAGLRSVFIVGDKNIINKFSKVRSFSCAGTPLPILNTAIMLLKDEKHVEKNRKQYREKFILSESVLKNYPGFYMPKGSIFLWLNVPDGQVMTERLWTEESIKVLPGSFFAVADKNGNNPGKHYIRLALVSDINTISTAMDRMKNLLLDNADPRFAYP